MTTKKIAATLGTGTLGAGGAAGAAAWKFGLLGGTSYFANATEFDKKAVDSNNWETVEGGKDEVAIKVEEEGETWQCTIRGIVFGNDQSKRETIKKQVEEFVNKIKDDEIKRKKFVEKCAKSRLNTEKTESAKNSTIELEVEENAGKLKNLDDLLNGDFVGLKRVEEEYQNILSASEESLTVETQEDEKNKKIFVNMKFGDWECSVTGEVKDSNYIKGEVINYDPLGQIFISESDSVANVDDKYAKNEKKKFFIRNCLENNKKIEGLKMVRNSTTGGWKFENLEEEILTKMYKNPTPVKPKNDP